MSYTAIRKIHTSSMAASKRLFFLTSRGMLMAAMLLFGLAIGQSKAQTEQQLPLQNLSAFEDPAESWRIAGGVSAPLEKENTINATEGSGILVNDPSDHNGADLLTNFEHGDIDLELDYMMAKGSNSGIYLQGRYEIQLLDSWTVEVPTSGNNGGIYERWDTSRPAGKEGFQGYAPRQNASRAPGLWQHLEISFQAPRFDDNGNKIKNAKIIRAKLNGVTIHEGIELQGPTRGALGDNEVAQGPLRLQGDHGAIAFRNINIRRYDGIAPTVKDLKFKVFEGDFDEQPDLDTLTAFKSGTSERLTTDLVGLPDRFLLQYTGTIYSKEAGDYQFNLNTAGGQAILLINGEEVILSDSNEGKTVALPEGASSFEIRYLKQASRRNSDITFTVSGDQLRTHVLSGHKLGSSNKANSIYVKANEKPLLRSFMDLPNGNRITHAVSVSSSDKVHYTYDLKSGNVVQLWRGKFLNATPMWYSRGDGSSRPNGSVVHLLENASLALNKLKDKKASWSSDTAGTGFKTKGYHLDKDNEPTFQYQMYGTSVKDKIRVIEGGKGVQRTLIIQEVPDKLYLRLAAGSSIDKAGNNRYIVDDQSYYIETDETIKPMLRSVDGHQELIISARSTISYSILF